ncbi:MAG: Bifunctional homocysteine S-methyltransferase/5,10-methylenetetrahydrofolate reductase [Chloroflexi bacterium]|nr:Bifunctional homocysteine S-methyltransferase/5,10-methylenetetrahydrofolate reductase [Chloroflexota bacterium]MBT9165739.1 Bifunctional homocysteine S-methyltransferase/5,10-methylenetetrahydrofolate reductase [Chloroflexota bacterium]
MTQSLREALDSGRFVITSEIGPPKGTNIARMLHHIDLLKDKVDALNVTDHQSSVMRFPSIGGCLAIKERGGEPILQMTCRDRNRLALQAELLLAYTRGIRNVLCLTGDAIPVGDHKQARGVFDLDSSQLLHTIRLMESGKDLGGNDLDGAVEFCAGAIVTPEAKPLEPQLARFEKKVEAGAEFFQTQAIYDLENFTRFMEFARQFRVKVLAGIILLVSARMARYMNDNVPGVLVPQNLIDELASAPKGEALSRGIEIAGRMIATLRKDAICDGVHVMAIGRE